MMKQLLIIWLIASVMPVLSQDFSGVDYVIKKSIEQEVFPGAAVIVGTKSEILYKEAYGNFNYEPGAPEVRNNSIFDLASLTKVFATTQCIMKLYDQGKLKLDDPVAKYIPNFAQNAKGDITIKNLLLHNSGMPDYYTPKKGQSRESIIDSIYARHKAYPTGSGTVYSCLNFVTLMQVVEEVTGKRMSEYYMQNFTEPLQLTNTMFLPPEEIHDRILPATPQLKGIVHDPLARGLEGLSGNAGLFSTTGDLAEFCQLMLKKGQHKGRRFYSEETVEKFITPPNKGSSRALGWDTNIMGNKSCGSLFSEEAFGHTGYTGTSAWCDPQKNLFVVFLTNRVYPDDEASVSHTRKAVHDAVVMAYENIPPQPTVKKFINYSDSELLLQWDNNSHLGPVEKTVVMVNSGEGFTEYNTYKANISKVKIRLEEFDISKMISLKLINKSAENKGISSDIFALRGNKNELLVVDAQDELPSDKKPLHESVLYHELAVPENISFETCHSSEVGTEIELDDYKYVFWVASEDNTPHELFTEKQIKELKKYFNKGGNIFVNGSEIGWAMGREGKSEKNREFYMDFLKAGFQGDASNSYKIKGAEGSPFENIEFNYGNEKSLYEVEYPDYMTAANGGKVCMKYENGKTAGVYFTDDNNNGKIVYLGFPFETISREENRKTVMNILFKFFE